MKKSLLLALTLGFVFASSAQAQVMFDRSWGAKAGVSVSSADVTDIGGTLDKSNQTGFAGGLVGLYARTPGLRRERSVFPTPQGLGYAKDAWLLAIGVSLTADGLLARRPAVVATDKAGSR